MSISRIVTGGVWAIRVAAHAANTQAILHFMVSSFPGGGWFWAAPGLTLYTEIRG